MTLVNYQFVMNHLRWNLAQRNYCFEVIVTTRSLQFMYLLYRLGMIRRLIKMAPKKYRVYLSWTSAKGAYPNFRCYTTPSKMFTMSYRSLQIANTHIGASYIVLSTSQGLLTHTEALQRRTGGVLLGVLS